MKYVFALMCCVVATPGLAGVNIGNTPTGGTISAFGTPNSQTYGQVFTAPITGKLTSFTLSLNGGVGALRGAVGTWNGTPSYSNGGGSPTTLFTSAPVTSSGATSYTFAPNASVTAGQLYVAYLSVFGVPGASGFTSMPLGTSAPGLNYFVWNNTSNPSGNPSWNYFFNTGNAQFAASFDAVAPVPEPEAWASMVLGLGLAGWVARRRKAKLAVA